VAARPVAARRAGSSSSQNDPFWKQFNADLSAQGIADEAGAKAQTQRAIIQFGEAPTNLTGQAASWIDDTTRQLASQNTTAGTSQLARINKFNTDQIRSIRNALAARGALRSGELGHQLGENQQQYTNAQYDQRTALTDSLSGIQAGYAAAQRQAQMARAQALGQVTNELLRAARSGVRSGGVHGGCQYRRQAECAREPARQQNLYDALAPQERRAVRLLEPVAAALILGGKRERILGATATTSCIRALNHSTP
jgi:hypothetical protein